MKKILLTMVLALVAVAGFSQASFNVRVGMSMNNYASMDGADMRVSYTAGLGLDYAITDMWSFQSGLMFSGKGAKVGAAVGAVAGVLTGNGLEGAIKGAVIGGTGGAILGKMK